MNEKVTLQYLIEALAKRHQMNLKDADVFVKSFFEQIRCALERDKYVKIKGLGTFKRIEIESRGNDNGEGEERTGSQGRFKITFTPDASMRELINKPFSHFETVVLNEHTHFDDMDEEGMEHLPETELSEEATVKSSDDGKMSVGSVVSVDSENIMADSKETGMPGEEASSSEDSSLFQKESSGEANRHDTSMVVESEIPVTVTESIGENSSGEAQMTDNERTCLTDEGLSVSPLEKTVESEVSEQVVSDDGALNEESLVPLSEVSEETDNNKEEERTASIPEQPEEHLFSSSETENTIDETPLVTENLSADTDKKSQKEERNKIPWCMFATILLVGVLIGGGIIWTLFSGRRYIPESLLRELLSEKKVDNETLAPKVSEMKKSLDIIPVMDSVKPESVTKRQDSVPKKPVSLTLPATTSSVSVPTIQPVAPAKQDKPQAVKRETLADTVEYIITGTMDTYTLQSGESLVKVALKYYGNKKLWLYIVRHNRKIIKNPDNVPVGTILQIPKLSPKNGQ